MHFNDTITCIFIMKTLYISKIVNKTTEMCISV